MPLPLPPSDLIENRGDDRIAPGTTLAITFLGSLGVWGVIIGLIFWR